MAVATSYFAEVAVVVVAAGAIGQPDLSVDFVVVAATDFADFEVAAIVGSEGVVVVVTAVATDRPGLGVIEEAAVAGTVNLAAS